MTWESDHQYCRADTLVANRSRSCFDVIGRNRPRGFLDNSIVERLRDCFGTFVAETSIGFCDCESGKYGGKDLEVRMDNNVSDTNISACASSYVSVWKLH